MSRILSLVPRRRYIRPKTISAPPLCGVADRISHQAINTNYVIEAFFKIRSQRRELDLIYHRSACHNRKDSIVTSRTFYQRSQHRKRSMYPRLPPVHSQPSARSIFQRDENDWQQTDTFFASRDYWKKKLVAKKPTKTASIKIKAFAVKIELFQSNKNIALQKSQSFELKKWPSKLEQKL